jgi:hypothetical protein
VRVLSGSLLLRAFDESVRFNAGGNGFIPGKCGFFCNFPVPARHQLRGSASPSDRAAAVSAVNGGQMQFRLMSCEFPLQSLEASKFVALKIVDAVGAGGEDDRRQRQQRLRPPHHC